MQRNGWISSLVLCAWIVARGAEPAPPSAETDRTALAVDAITRLKNVDLDQNARLKEAVFKLLEKTRGTPNYLRLIQHFNLPGNHPGLLEVALGNPGTDAGTEAVRLLLRENATNQLQKVLTNTNAPESAAIVQALGNAGDRRAVDL